MKITSYRPEIIFLIITLLVSLGGFWHLFLGESANPEPHHFLHLITSLLWLSLILIQLMYITKRKFSLHRKIGLSIFIIAPLTVATVAYLSVHSASRALATGQPDILIVQNVMITLELGLVIFLAFLLMKSRLIHGNLLLASSLFFLGIALFFALMGFIPQLKIEGPDTFYRFGIAASTAKAICAGIGLVFFLKNWKIGWPWLLVPACFYMNDFINSKLYEYDKIQDLTAWVGSMSESMTFFITLIVFTLLLLMAWKINGRLKGFNINTSFKNR
ncbi:hypothetical protein [Winogradskyella sp. A3E31]|uniref:hypothetical protein n=1 Tax=Winogradskyella sp. A3E31 TaxID=3349637 RepID=UPI00398A7343